MLCPASSQQRPSGRGRPSYKRDGILAGQRADGRVQMLNDEPQPQVALALGFLTTNCDPRRSSM